MSKKQINESYRTKLVEFANSIGFTVELDSPMKDVVLKYKKVLLDKTEEGELTFGQLNELLNKEIRPSGVCQYDKRTVLIREGKGLQGQVSTLIHELTHALGFGSQGFFSYLGDAYNELVCESVTQFVTQAIGIERTKQTKEHVLSYGFGDYLDSSVTNTITKIFLDELGG